MVSGHSTSHRPDYRAADRFRANLRVAALSVLALPLLAPTFARADETVAIGGVKDLLAYFEKIGYTPQAWQAGIREVPRVYVASVGTRWREKTTKEITVVDKKRIFFRLLAPIVLRINELITEDRTRALPIARQIAAGKEPAAADLAWFKDLATRYKVIASPDATLDASAANEVIRRVDVIPPSLALAQSAVESGWGTSRFASEGNSLFGQWSWSEGITPAGQRTEEHGDHRIAAFKSTGASVVAYAYNLNTHGAYEGFRRKREELRRANRPIRGKDLVGTLTRYSERGQAYVDELLGIMRHNRLDPADDAYLEKMEIVRLVPKEAK